MRRRPIALASALTLAAHVFALAADPPAKLAPGVRGLVTRAPGSGIKVDGKVAEWGDAFCTPVHYNHAKLEDRAAQFYYAWDDAAFYVALRALDRHRADLVPLANLQDGDAVEFYFDARPAPALRGKDWSAGAIHFFFSAFEGDRIGPRWVMRRGITTSETKLQGVEIAASLLPGEVGYEVEFKLPWANFPGFAPKPGTLLGLDAELCSGDGARRSDRTFAYGSPLSVQQPASQGLVQLVDAFAPEYLAQVGPAAFPFWVETPWTQPERARDRATLAIPPAFIDRVGGVEVRIHDTDGAIVRTVKASIERFGPPDLGFARAVASWPIDDFPPNTFFATARVTSKSGQILTTVAPRLVEEAQMTGR